MIGFYTSFYAEGFFASDVVDVGFWWRFWITERDTGDLVKNGRVELRW